MSICASYNDNIKHKNGCTTFLQNIHAFFLFSEYLFSLSRRPITIYLLFHIEQNTTKNI